MKLTIATIAFNSPPATRDFWGLLGDSTKNQLDTEFLVIDNGSTDGTGDYLRKIIAPHWPRLSILRNPENVGIPVALNQCVREAEGDIVAVLHNDLWMLHPGWDTLAKDVFAAHPRCGLGGFFGAGRADPGGGRSFCVSNLMNAEDHGARCEHPRRVALFDGLALIFRKAAWKQWGGVDESFGPHHYYDKDASLANLAAGWENWLIPVRCYHADGSGHTTTAGDYERWAAKKLGVPDGQGNATVYAHAKQKYLAKWGHKLPLEVHP